MKTLIYGIVIMLFLSVNVLQAQQIKDREGNVYSTIEIGDKTWMAEDLRMTTPQPIETQPGVLRDPIQTSLNKIEDADTWEIAGKKGLAVYASYNNKLLEKGGKNGYLYNWYAVDCNICPSGYRIPTADELKELIAFQAKAKKNVGDGIRKENGEFVNLGSSQKTYWSKTGTSDGNALNGCAFTNNGISWSDGVGKGFGYYIRCVSDTKEAFNYRIGDIHRDGGIVFEVSDGGKHGLVVKPLINEQFSFDEAVAKVKALGNGWKLPSLSLLKKIGEYAMENELADFTDSYYWSSVRHNEEFAKYVRFSDGYSANGPVTNKFNLCIVKSF